MDFGGRFFCFERKFSLPKRRTKRKNTPQKTLKYKQKRCPNKTVWTSALSVPKKDDTRTYPQMILSISYVRDGDGMQEPCVRSVWTYARGSRACYGACAQMVEMFSSLYLFFIFSCISFVSEYSFHKTDCKGSLFPSIHQSFLLFMQHFFAVAGN